MKRAPRWQSHNPDRVTFRCWKAVRASRPRQLAFAIFFGLAALPCLGQLAGHDVPLGNVAVPDAAMPMLLAVTVNGVAEAVPLSVLLDERARTLWIADADWRRLRLRSPERAPRMFEGQAFHRLDQLASTAGSDGGVSTATRGVDGALSFAYDAAQQALSLQLPSSSFQRVAAALQPGAGLALPTTGELAGYLSYDLFAETSRAQRAGGGLFDLALSTRWGQLSSGQIAAFRDSRHSESGDRSRWQSHRLDSTYALDLPDRLVSLRIGDFVANGGNGGLGADPARMGGIQVASNFAIRPGFLTQPLMSLTGQSTLPSVVEVFVNGVSAGRQNVPPGPFTVDGIPGVNGYGEVRLLVRDVLGREQVIVSSMFGSSQLLAPGLDDFSLSFGRLRYGYGVQSSDYRDWVGTGYWRRGLTPWLTAAVAAESSRLNHNGGVGATFLLPYVATVNLAASVSRGQAGSTAERDGHSLLAGFDRRMKSYSFGAQWRYASADYRTATSAAAERDSPTQMRTRRDVSAYASVSAGAFGALSLTYLAQTRDLGAAFSSAEAAQLASTRTIAAGYSLSLQQFGQVTLGVADTAARRSSQPRRRAYYVNYFLPLDNQHLVGVNSSRNESGSPADGSGPSRARTVRTMHSLVAQRMLPLGEGYGYRVEVSDPWSFRAEGRYASQRATWGIDVSGDRYSQGVRASLSGAIAAVDGGLYLSRRISDSFVVVDAGGFSHVRVYLDNNLIGRTDVDGRLLVPALRSYQPHRVRIDAEDVPLTAEIDDTRLDVVPARRSGNLLRFPLRLSRGAQLRLLDNAGAAIPAGAVVWLGGRQFPVAHDGEVYMLGLDTDNVLQVRSGERGCRVDVRFAPGADALPHLGNFVCVLQ